MGKIKRLLGESLGQVITLRVLIQKDSVCTGKTPTRFIHVDVLPVHMAGRFESTHGGGFFSVPHHTHHTTHANKMKQKMKQKMKEKMKEKRREKR